MNPKIFSMNNFNQQQAYQAAKTRLKEERAFYVHVGVYIAINIVSFIYFMTAFDSDTNWVFWLNVSRPFLWGIGLLGHGLWTFRRNIKWLKNTIYSKEWEQRKIKELMNDDDF